MPRTACCTGAAAVALATLGLAAPGGLAHQDGPAPTLRVADRSLAVVLERGTLRVRCRLPVAGRCAVHASLSRPAAERFGLADERIGGGVIELMDGRSGRVPVRLHEGALERLGAAGRLRVRVHGVGSTADGAWADAAEWIVLD